ncbi:MAG: DUF2975 domain-containing protein [Ruminococcaceae bacterium]|nr:DUF2975 domain-containing protein [Oscillospiraceae bacterium]
MLKVSNKFSINLSIAISILFFIACIVGAFIMPTLTNMLIDTPDNIGNRGDITETERILVHIAAYLILAVFMFADVLMFTLLQRVKRGFVFTEKSVSLIRGVSWCCFAVCMLFAFLGIYFQLSFIVAFLGIFLGVCLRVIKNVIAEAVEIKNENDLTV